MIKTLFLVLLAFPLLSFGCPSGDCGDKECEHHQSGAKQANAHAHEHEEHSELFQLKPERAAKRVVPKVAKPDAEKTVNQPAPSAKP